MNARQTLALYIFMLGVCSLAATFANLVVTFLLVPTIIAVLVGPVVLTALVWVSIRWFEFMQ